MRAGSCIWAHRVQSKERRPIGPKLLPSRGCSSLPRLSPPPVRPGTGSSAVLQRDSVPLTCGPHGSGGHRSVGESPCSTAEETHPFASRSAKKIKKGTAADYYCSICYLTFSFKRKRRKNLTYLCIIHDPGS